MSVCRRTRKVWIKFSLTILAVIVTVSQVAQGQGEWEMRVCADPHNIPISGQDQEGFDNRIAEIIANELQAELTYVWTPSGADMVRRHLRTGECDLIMGVAEGAEGLLNTVAYYRTPYVFVYREDSGLELHSLDDDVLKELKIGTYPFGVPHNALVKLDLAENVVLQRPVTQAGRPDYSTPLIQAVLEGEVDLAIAYGPEAGYFAEQHPGILKLVPVSPEITPSGSQMFQILTIGVRPGDVALRDRLNIALAQRWDDIQAVFNEYGIPLQPLPKPIASEPGSGELIRVGAVLPMATGNPATTDTIAEAARIGALMAEDLVGREATATGTTLEILLANSPSKEAAIRAAERLVTTEGVVALVGGLGEGQARALSDVAEERGALFFNVGSTDDSLRGEACRRNSFHVEASTAMYLDALTGWFSDLGHRRWFLLYEESEEGKALYERAMSAITQGNGEAQEVDSAGLAPGPGAYQDELDQIRDVAPDIILLLLDPEDQEFFLSQYEHEGLDFPVSGFPFPIMQTREFLTRLRQVAPRAGTGHRAALWETTLETNGADELNDLFISRSGEPMDPSGWATYAAIKMLYKAVESTGTQETSALVNFLESPEAVFDVSKGPGTSFRPWDHQLRQPLYLIGIDPEAEWGMPVYARVAIADVVGQVPALHLPEANPIEQLDRLGDGSDESRCSF